MSCGTGPWIVRKNIYFLYEQPVTLNVENNKLIKTNGYYIQTGKLEKNNTSSRSVLIFYSNGYFMSFNVDDKTYNNKLKHNDFRYIKELDWYKIENDSLTLEYFGNSNMEMCTSVFYKRGIIVNDTMLRIATDQYPNNTYNYKFVKDDNIPKYQNLAKYLNKKWYKQKIHISRK